MLKCLSVSPHIMAPTSVGGPLPTHSRVGREQQRYGIDGERLVAGCIPVRLSISSSGPEIVSILLITSRGGKGYVFPKGGWELDESCLEAAARETVEEAGVRGKLEDAPVGRWEFYSGKAERVHSAHKGRCIAHMFAMHVEEELSSWPESPARKRIWCSVPDAIQKCRHDWMKDAIRAWVKSIDREDLLCNSASMAL
ncbi:hypothetical protein WJX74_003919 [Apatococcus lobatus]|uniref:Nudix hydrolase domain-containing protein n=1 Tax=Apatococcus lobatus TaxID=904363 RepID=A0AAW1RZR0_9CHLO